MPTLMINGQSVPVDESFLTMSPEQQDAAVEYISQNMGQEQVPPQPAAPQSQAGSVADSLGQGVSFGFSDEIAGGTAALADSAAGLFGKGSGKPFGEVYQGVRDQARKQNKAFSARNPKTALAAEIGGSLLTGGAGLAKTGLLKGTQTLGKLAAAGAAQGGIYGAGASEADSLSGVATDTAKGAALGGVTGAVAPAIVGGVKKLAVAGGKALGSAANETYKKAVSLLDKYKIPTTYGQRSGSAPVQATETTTAAVPLIGKPLKTIIDKQRHALQSKLMAMAGFTDDVIKKGELTQDGLDGAAKKFGERYKAALSGKKIEVTDDFVDTLSKVQADYTSKLASTPKNKVMRVVNELFDQATDGPMTGEKYQKLRSQLGKFTRREADPGMKELYKDLKYGLDDAFLNSVDDVTGKTMKTINREYAQFKQLETIFDSGVGDSVAGMIPLGKLSQIAHSAKHAGGKEWKELVRAAKTVIPDKYANSQTASRAVGQGMLATMGGGLGFLGGVPGVAQGMAGMYGISSALARPQAAQKLAQTVGRGATNAGLLAAPIVAQGAQPYKPSAQPQPLLGGRR